MDLMFSVNRYDQDGDLLDKCVELWLNKDYSIHFHDLNAFKKFIDTLNQMLPEMTENWEMLNQ